MPVRDLVHVAQRHEARQPQHAGAGAHLLVPDVRQHQLQGRRRDAVRAPAVAGADLGDRTLDESVLDRQRHVLRARAVEDRERAADRRRSAGRVEGVEAERVREQRGDAPAQAVEAREAVVAQRQQHAEVEAGVDRVREFALEGIAGRGIRVVEEVLLELVEHQQHRATHRLRECRDDAFEGGCGIDAGRRPGRERRDQFSLQRREEVRARPRTEHRDRRARPRLQRRHDACEQHRALADAARAVEHRQRGGRQVRRDDALLALAAEEQSVLGLGVGAQADVGAGLRARDIAHRRAPAATEARYWQGRG